MPPLVISNLSGGRNGVDSVVDPNFPDGQAIEVLNVDFVVSGVGRKRPGSDSVALNGGTNFGAALQFASRFIPDGNEAHAELWVADANGLVKRMRNGAAWDNVTLADAITGNVYDLTSVTFNGKQWLFYKSGKSRSHLFDPNLAVPKVRVVGLAAQTVAPTLANSAVAGAYPATARFARTRTIQLNGTVVVRRSEPSPASLTFTPDAAHSGWVITRGALPGEDETHWEIEVSLDNSNWNKLYASGTNVAGAAIDKNVVAVTDATAAGSFTGFDVSDPVGNYTNFPSMKFAITDANRIIGVGSYETGTETRQSRIWLSPALGSTVPPAGDDERTINRATLVGYLDLNENDGGQATGIGGTINGVFWVFKYRQIIRCTPTGDVSTPYTSRRISSVIGAVNHQGIVMGEDAFGAPTIYFWSSRGPYGLGTNGLSRFSRDIEDVITGTGGYPGINLSATMPVFGLYYPDIGQVWWWIAEKGSGKLYPTRRLRLDVHQATRQDRYGTRGGWHVDDGDASAGWAAAMFANTPGIAMSMDLKPYLGRDNATLYKCGSDTALDDAGVPYRSYVVTKSLVPPSMFGQAFTISHPIIVADAQAGTELEVRILRDFSKGAQVATVDLTPETSEASVIREVVVDATSEQGILQVQIGDVEAVSAKWNVDTLVIPLALDSAGGGS